MEYIINTTSTSVNTEDIANICNLVFKRFKIKNPVYNIIIVNNQKIKEINKTYRNKDEATDVISFAFEEINDIEYKNIRFLGEVYISIDKVKSQAKEYNHSIKRELCFLTVHGLLHLLGFDHVKKDDKIKMRETEEEILNSYEAKR